MALISALCILFIALSICYEVLGRYFFQHPLMWTIEISEYLQIYFVFFSAAWVLREKGHVTLDIAVNRFGPSGRKTCAIIADILGIAVAAILCIFSGIIAYEQMLLHIPVIKSLEVPKWLIILPIPMGMFLLTVEFTVKLINDLHGRT